jgi:hypothetical protein
MAEILIILAVGFNFNMPGCAILMAWPIHFLLQDRPFKQVLINNPTLHLRPGLSSPGHVILI